MQLVDLLNRANNGYDDGYLENYFDSQTGEFVQGKGDTLAEFIVIELQETFEPKAPDEAQIDEAVRVMDMARRDIESVIQSLQGDWPCRYCEHMKRISSSRENYIGKCEFDLQPTYGNCGSFELAQCYEGHDPRKNKN